MPVEAATYINQLVPGNPATNDPVQQGQQQIKLLKTVLQSTFPNVVGAVSATDVQLSAIAKLLGAAGGASVTLTDSSTTATVALAATTTGASLTVTPLPTTATPSPAAVTAFTVDTSGNVAFPEFLNAFAVQQQGNLLVPRGIIAMWSGAANAIPAGWLLCNGANGTPNLMDRFIVGAGNTYGVGAAGGTASQNITTQAAGSHNHGGATASGGGQALTASCDTQGSHSHTGTTGGTALTVDELPPHSHQLSALLPGSPAGLAYGSGTGYAGTGTTTSVGSGNAHSHGIATDGAHAHNISVSPVQSFQLGIGTDGNHSHTVSFNNLPPYYALCFIMKS